MKIYEEEIAQASGILGASIDRDKSKEYRERASSSKPAENFPYIEMPFPEDTSYEEPHPEARSPLEQKKNLEGTKEKLPANQNMEDLETPHKQKEGKIHKRIRKLKKENKLLMRKAKKVEALKQKVGKLREIIK